MNMSLSESTMPMDTATNFDIALNDVQAFDFLCSSGEVPGSNALHFGFDAVAAEADLKFPLLEDGQATLPDVTSSSLDDLLDTLDIPAVSASVGGSAAMHSLDADFEDALKFGTEQGLHKTLTKRLKNRASVQKCRQRKRERAGLLELERFELTGENKKMQDVIEEVKQAIRGTKVAKLPGVKEIWGADGSEDDGKEVDKEDE